MNFFWILLFVTLLTSGGIPALATDFVADTGHSLFSPAAAVKIIEAAPVRFGNFAVTTLGSGDAHITLSPAGVRSVTNGTDQIVLLSGSSHGTPGGDDAGGEGPGLYNVSGAGASSHVYITFSDSAGGSNPIVLRGPIGSDEFTVDDFTFNLDGTDGGGDYITTDGSGNATVAVGATLYTKAGATTYAEGTYRGMFNIIASY